MKTMKNISKILFVIDLIICLPLYGYLCLTSFDPVTGFFASASTVTTIFYGVLLIIPLLMIFISTKLQRNLSFSISNSKILAVLSFLLGGAIILNGVYHLLNFLPIVQNGGAMFSTMLIASLQIPVAAVSGFVFLRLGVGYLRENIANRTSASFVFPVIWALIACIETFQNYPQIAGMPEHTLYLLCLLSFTLFLIGQSRILSNIQFSKGVYWVNAFGLCTALFGLTMSCGEIVAFSKMSLPIFDAVFVFILALYCLAFSINTYVEE